MRIIFLIFWFAILMQCNVHADTVWVRSDGDNSCDGTKNLPKKADKHCAYKTYKATMTQSATKTDTVTIGKGTFVVSFQPVVTTPVPAPVPVPPPSTGTLIDFNDFKFHESYYADKAFTGQIYKIRRYQKGKKDQYFRFQYLGSL